MADSKMKYDGRVAKIVDNQTIVLNIGRRNGVVMSDKFVVFSLGEEVLDPETGESLGTLEDIKGKGHVVHLQDHLCTIETYELDMPQTTSHPSKGPRGRKGDLYRDFADVQRGDYARKIGLLSQFFGI